MLIITKKSSLLKTGKFQTTLLRGADFKNSKAEHNCSVKQQLRAVKVARASVASARLKLCLKLHTIIDRLKDGSKT